jgi:mersacidin/lichenicidin family type 2 lantibiotic
MSNVNIIRAWKDDDYLESLSEEERSHLPENPAGIIELSDREMEAVAGGFAENTAVCINVNVNNNIDIFNNTVGLGYCGVTNNGGICNNG